MRQNSSTDGKFDHVWTSGHFKDVHWHIVNFQSYGWRICYVLFSYRRRLQSDRSIPWSPKLIQSSKSATSATFVYAQRIFHASYFVGEKLVWMLFSNLKPSRRALFDHNFLLSHRIFFFFLKWLSLTTWYLLFVYNCVMGQVFRGVIQSLFLKFVNCKHKHLIKVSSPTPGFTMRRGHGRLWRNHLSWASIIDCCRRDEVCCNVIAVMSLIGDVVKLLHLLRRKVVHWELIVIRWLMCIFDLIGLRAYLIS